MKTSKKILFQLNYLYHLPALEPIIETFVSDKRYDIAVALTRDFDYRLGILRKKKSEEYLLKFTIKNVRTASENEIFDIVFATDTVYSKQYKDAKICMVYHGPTFNKSVTYRELRKHKDDKYLIFVESQYAVDKFQEADCIGSSETRIVGFPKLDPIINNKYDRSEILSQLGLNEKKKTILYAPTYKPTSLHDLSEKIFDVTKNYNLIIKLHHYSWMGKYANRKQSRIIKNQVGDYEHAVLLPRDFYNILPLFTVADTLISEASGAITEFLITGKVGIIYDLEDEVLMRSDSESLLLHDKEFLRGVYIHINNPSQLSIAIKKALNPTKTRLAKVNIAKEKYFYKCDGKASQRIKSIIDNIFFDDITTSPA
ncbi:MAG: CDP-glycerol glycerophosphotransferase [Planctomycetia bacterium]|nr:CDP-glycerol glycerophosphotransferase [Planctomycetia bacterium]